MQSKGTREEWRRRVRAWRESGLSRAEFARRAKLHPATLTWWCWRLASEGEAGPHRRGRAARRRRAGAPLRFVEIATRAAAAVEGESEGRIELEVGRVRVRIPDEFRAGTLVRVLEVLEARS